MMYDIKHSELESLLLATPFARGTELTFSDTLTEEVFFNKIFAPEVLSGDDKEVVDTNKEFDKEMKDALESLDNEHARVKLIHIKGYAGSGKTTFIHYLVWKLKQKRDIQLCFLDFEGEHPAESPIFADVMGRILRMDISEVIVYLSLVLNDYVFNNYSLLSVKDDLGLFLEAIRESQKPDKWSEISLRKCFKQMEVIMKKDEYLYFLLMLDFLIVVLERFQNSDSKSMIIVVDNIDSMEPLSEEIRLIPVMKRFISTFYAFIRDNIHQEVELFGKIVSEVISSSKFMFFFNTRLVTARHYGDIIFRDDELEARWKTIELPEQYFSHREIIQNKIDFYNELKGTEEEEKKINQLKKVFTLADVVYSNQLFKKLFNGNIRHCMNTLCYFASKDAIMNKFSPCIEGKYPADGVNGMVINAVFNYFKDNDIYSNKLGLAQCSKDGTVTCSRLVLTIVKESDGRCSMAELFRLLLPVYSVSEISHCVYNLSEANRIRWRRLITFDVRFPDDPRELMNQGDSYQSGTYNNNDFTYVVLCKAGEAYLESVIPHFEFMLSRHNAGRSKKETILKRPLFVGWRSEDGAIQIDDIRQKIDTVFQDVRDCCYNCKCFNEKILNAGIATSSDFLGTKYNYKSTNRENPLKQSYESRLIFGHLGYIERFRRFLLSQVADNEAKLSINKLIVPYLKSYLELYMNLNEYLQNDNQTKAAVLLDDLIKSIENKNYEDYSTRVDLSYSKG